MSNEPTYAGYTLDEIAYLHGCATPGEWTVPVNDKVNKEYWGPVDDDIAIAVAHNVLPALIAEIRRLRAEVERLETKLKAEKWLLQSALNIPRKHQ